MMTSFNVTWKSNTKPTGKVFAKKRKPKTDNNITNLPRQNSTDKQSKVKDNKIEKLLSVKKKIKQPVIKDTQTNNNLDENPVSAKSTKLVKRKQKKDKLLAKIAADNSQKTSAQLSKQKEHSLFSVGNKDVYVKSNTKGKSVVEEVFSTNKKFNDLNIHKYIVSNLEKIGFTTLMNVQEKSIPVILSGKNVLVSTYCPKIVWFFILNVPFLTCQLLYFVLPNLFIEYLVTEYFCDCTFYVFFNFI